MKRLIYAPKALVDIDLIYDYTDATWGARQADEYILAIRNCCHALSSEDRAGRRLDRVKPGYRCVTSGSHFVIYKPTERAVTIVRILHRRMNISAHL